MLGDNMQYRFRPSNDGQGGALLVTLCIVKHFAMNHWVGSSERMNYPLL